MPRLTVDNLYSDTYSDTYGTANTVLIAFQVALTTAPGATPVWVDLGDRVNNFSVRRGRQRTLEKFTAGSLSITLKNNDRYLDPLYAAGPYYGYLKPMRKCRLSVFYEGTTYYLFTGYVDGWPQSYRKGTTGSAFVTLQATDGFKALQSLGLASSVYDVEVTADEPIERFRLSEASGSTVTTSTSGLELTAFGSVTAGAGGLVAKDSDAAASYDGTTNSSGHTSTAYLDLSANSAWTIEGIVRPTSLPARVSELFGVGIHEVNRARVILLDTGIVRINIGSASTGFNISGVTALQADATYHIAITKSGTTYKVYLNGALDASDTSALTPNANSRFWIGASSAAQSPSLGFIGTIDEVAVYDSALSAARISAHYDAMSAPWASEPTGTRIGKILDLIDWPSVDRHIDAGNSTLQATALTGSALEYLQKVEESESGALYMTGEGKLRFRERHAALKSPYITSQGTFGDTAAELGYYDIVINQDDTQLRNLARVTRDGGVTQTAQDATSIADFFEHTYERSGQLFESDNESLDAANWIVGHYKDPATRVDALVIRPTRDPATMFPQVLGRDMGDRVTAKRRPQAIGSAISAEVIVEGIAHDVDAATQMWQTTWNLSSAEAQSYWLLDSATLAVLDSTTRLAY